MTVRFEAKFSTVAFLAIVGLTNIISIALITMAALFDISNGDEFGWIATIFVCSLIIGTAANMILKFVEYVNLQKRRERKNMTKKEQMEIGREVNKKRATELKDKGYSATKIADELKTNFELKETIEQIKNKIVN